jgi:RNase H-like domain found in reverse transcriptase/Reverse transcriptase (RNA-dependent DNA polymerase)
MPQIEQIMEELSGKELFTIFDIRSGYHNIRIKEEDRWKVAFKTPFGLYHPNVMLFGLNNSPATFQQMVDRVFKPIYDEFPGECHGYMDDFLIATHKDPARHRLITRKVLQVFRDHSLFLKLPKCEFEKDTVEYLGIYVKDGTIRIDPTKQSGLATWPRQLSTVTQVRSTLGVLGYQRPFIRGFAHIAKPLTSLLKKGQTFKWMQECTDALNKLIDIVTSDPVLFRPDETKQFELEVDASQYAIGAILYQRDNNGKQRPVAYHSETLNEAERGYNIFDRELMVVVKGLENW